MRLYSLQTKNFSLTDGEVIHSKSRFYNDKSLRTIKEAYRQLAEPNWFGTNQIVWCFVDGKESSKYLIKWVLEVPTEQIRFVDDRIWNKLIGSDYYPHSLASQWHLEAIDKHCDSRKYIAKRVAEYHDQPPPEGGWITQLFVDYPPPKSVESVSALLRHPVDPSWVVSDGHAPAPAIV